GIYLMPIPMPFRITSSEWEATGIFCFSRRRPSEPRFRLIYRGSFRRPRLISRVHHSRGQAAGIERRGCIVASIGFRPVDVNEASLRERLAHIVHVEPEHAG